MSEPIARPQAQVVPLEELLEIKRIALSRIMPAKHGGTQDVDLERWKKKSPDEWKIVDRFLRKHIERAWTLPQSNGTRGDTSRNGLLSRAPKSG